MNRLVLAVLLVGCHASHSHSPDAAPVDLNRATGKLGAWQPGPALPVARANHCSVAIDNWVLAIGGNRSDGHGGFVTTDEIDAAQLGADGTLGAWQIAGKLPSAASQPTCTVDGHTLYVIGGIFAGASDGQQVWTATFDATGHLGAFASLGALPANVYAISTGAAVRGGALDVIDSQLPDMGDQTITARAPLPAPLAWTQAPWTGVNFHAQTQYAFGDTFVLSLGGYHDPAVGAVVDAFVAPIDAHGVVGTPAATQALYQPTAFGAAVVVDDWVFLAGGRATVLGAGSWGTYTVEAAHLTATGAVDGTWTFPTALPIARTNLAMALVGDYLVVTGGANTGPGDAQVFVSQVRYPPS